MKNTNTEGCPDGWVIGCLHGLVDLKDMKPDDVSIEEICWTLAKINRFGGRGNGNISVATHSITVMRLVSEWTDDKDVVLGALCHDMAEAYIGDVIRPIKKMIADVCDIEKSVMQSIGELYPIGNYGHELVRHADNVAVYFEAVDLGFNTSPWGFSEKVFTSERPKWFDRWNQNRLDYWTVGDIMCDYWRFLSREAGK